MSGKVSGKSYDRIFQQPSGYVEFGIAHHIKALIMVIMDLSGVHLRELARVIDAIRCHDDMFSAMQPPDEQ